MVKAPGCKGETIKNGIPPPLDCEQSGISLLNTHAEVTRFDMCERDRTKEDSEELTNICFGRR